MRIDLFKEIFAEPFEKYGFIMCKGDQSYLVRMAGDEIIHLITYEEYENYDHGHGKNYYSVRGGVISVYRHSVRVLRRPDASVSHMHDLVDFYLNKHYQNYDKEYCQKLVELGHYIEDDEMSMRLALRNLKNAAEEIILPKLDQVTDLDSCIRYYEEFFGDSLMVPEYDEKTGRFGCEYDEGFLYIKADRHDDLIPETKERIVRRCAQLDVNDIGYSPELISKKTEEKRRTLIARRDRIFNDPVIYASAQKEMEKCRERNLPDLRNYGLNI